MTTTSGAILVVDDETNIRRTFARALEPLGREVLTAVNGEEALDRLRERELDVILVDLRMPGMDGLEALRRIRALQPGAAVVVISAHGTIEEAVEAMKLGALDFVQKPCSPRELQDLVQRILRRPAPDSMEATDYASKLARARRCVAENRLDEAAAWVRQAIGQDPSEAAAYNLLGAVEEIGGAGLEAQKYYRAALDVDPTYRPARSNLERVAGLSSGGSVQLGGDEAQEGGGPEEGADAASEARPEGGEAEGQHGD